MGCGRGGEEEGVAEVEGGYTQMKGVMGDGEIRFHAASMATV
jgi:hypothetical protein